MQPKVRFNSSVTVFKFQPTALDGGLFYLMVPRNIFTPCGVPTPGWKGFCRPIGIKMKIQAAAFSSRTMSVMPDVNEGYPVYSDMV